QGLRGSAYAQSTRAEALADRCGGALTPALRRAAEPLPLTDREREIVMLIGEGLSSRAVADRMMLSVRTVEGHIYRAMAKTGASSRPELAARTRAAGARPSGTGGVPAPAGIPRVSCSRARAFTVADNFGHAGTQCAGAERAHSR